MGDHGWVGWIRKGWGMRVNDVCVEFLGEAELGDQPRGCCRYSVGAGRLTACFKEGWSVQF